MPRPSALTDPALFQVAVLAGALVAAASIAVYALRTGISPMPTLPAARRTLLAALPAEVSGAVHELGAGWGTLALPLARRYGHLPVLAWELSPLPWAVCTVRARIAGLTNLAVRRADFLAADLREAGLVVCYLYPGGMARLAPKLAGELGPGAVVVSHTFALPGWEPAAVHRAPDWFRSPIYVYRVTAAAGEAPQF